MVYLNCIDCPFYSRKEGIKGRFCKRYKERLRVAKGLGLWVLACKACRAKARAVLEKQKKRAKKKSFN